MRYFRLVFGLIVIVGALYILVAEHVTGASSNAFVNAPVITVRSPVAGDVDVLSRAVGSGVSADTVLFTVIDRRADGLRLDDLVLEHEIALSDVERLNTQIAAVEDHRTRLEQTYQAYASFRAQEIFVGVGADIDAGTEEFYSPERLLDLNAPQTDAVQDETVGVEGQENPESLRVLQLNGAKEGIFLDNSAGATWNYAYWSETARHLSARLQAELTAAQAVVTSYEERITRERQRMSRLTGDDVVATVNGVLWEKLSGNGLNIQRGDPVVQIADCSSTVVSLSVSEVVYNRLSTGDPAIFRLAGEGRVMEGTISRLAGASAEAVYENMAIKPSGEHLQRYDVTLIVPELRTSDGSSGCNLGKTGRVFFEDRPLDPLRRFLK